LSELNTKVLSGRKYLNQDGTIAIKDGIKVRNVEHSVLPKPAWLKIKAQVNPEFVKVQTAVHEHKLATVCEEAKCPNLAECWSHGTATIMLMGAICTRACKFCAVDTGNPHGKLDVDEPLRAAETAAIMNLDYIVLTSVNRDDLPDGGAAHYAKAIVLIKERMPKIKVEALTPDFLGDKAAIRVLLDSKVDVFAQNVETVSRLTHVVRDNRAGYEQSLEVLSYAKEYRPEVLTKTSLMLGLGETMDEILEALQDIKNANVDIVTLGQYLQPTKNHLPISRYVHPDEFNVLRSAGLDMGFLEVAAGPLVRSSYRADKVFKRNNLGL
jgi:lipoyl synthase